MAPSNLIKQGFGSVVRLSKQPSALQAYGTSLLLVVLLLLCFCSLFTPHFSALDDVGMAMIASGSGLCDSPDEHLRYTHVFIGFALKWLYQLNRDFPWYGGYLLASHAIALTAILAVFILNRSAGSAALRIALFLCFFMVAEAGCLTNLQFTSTALILALAGALTMMCWFDRAGDVDTKTLRNGVGLSAILLLGAFLVRLSSGELGLLLCGVLAVVRYFHLPKPDPRLFHCLGFLALILIVGELLWQVNSAYYSLDDRWTSFYAWVRCKQNLIDYHRVGDDSVLLDATGWSANDLAMFKNGLSLDPEVFSIPKLKKALAHALPFRSGLSPGYVMGQLWLAACDPFMVPALLTVAVAFWFLHKKYFGLARGATYLAAILGIALYLVCFMKFPQRVYLALAAFAIAVLLHYLDLARILALMRTTFGLTRRRQVVMMVLASALTARAVWSVYAIHHQASEVAIARSRTMKAVMGKLRLYPDQVLVLCAQPLDLVVWSVLPFENPSVCFSSMRLLIPRVPFLPLADDDMRKRGATDFHQLLQGEHVVLVDNAHSTMTRLIERFVWEHYHESLELEIAHRISIVRLVAYRAKCALLGTKAHG